MRGRTGGQDHRRRSDGGCERLWCSPLRSAAGDAIGVAWDPVMAASGTISPADSEGVRTYVPVHAEGFGHTATGNLHRCTPPGLPPALTRPSPAASGLPWRAGSPRFLRSRSSSERPACSPRRVRRSPGTPTPSTPRPSRSSTRSRTRPAPAPVSRASGSTPPSRPSRAIEARTWRTAATSATTSRRPGRWPGT